LYFIDYWQTWQNYAEKMITITIRKLKYLNLLKTSKYEQPKKKKLKNLMKKKLTENVTDDKTESKILINDVKDDINKL
jgi:hypothetical protein